MLTVMYFRQKTISVIQFLQHHTHEHFRQINQVTKWDTDKHKMMDGQTEKYLLDIRPTHAVNLPY